MEGHTNVRMENHVTTNFIWADGLADFLSNGATLAHLQCTGAPPFGTRFKKHPLS